MKLLIDEMYSGALAEQLRVRRYDVVSVHDIEYSWLEGSPDEQVFTVANIEGRAIVTENVSDFRRLEAKLFAQGRNHAGLIFTTNRQFPRGNASTLGRLLQALMIFFEQNPGELAKSIFLRPT